MKIGIVGIGAVGAATAMAIVLRGRARQLVLVNRNRARAKGVATDMRYGAPLSSPIAIADGDYGDLAGASVVIVAAGVNEKTGGATDRNDPAGRLRLPHSVPTAPSARCRSSPEGSPTRIGRSEYGPPSCCARSIPKARPV